MSIAEICLFAAGGLILVVGSGCAFGGVVLWRGGAEAWPDVVASAKVIRRTAIGLFIADSILTVAGVLVLLKFPWAAQIGTFAMALFVAGGYWGNHAVFGDFRPVHTTSNVVIAIVVSWLLWAGYPALGDGAAI